MDDVTLSELLDPATDTVPADESALVSSDDTQAFSELAEEMVSLTGAMFGLLLPGQAVDEAEEDVVEAQLGAPEEPQLIAAPEPIEIPQLGVAVPDLEQRPENALDLPQLIVDLETAEFTEFTEYPQFPETIELAVPESAAAPEPAPAVASPKSMALLQEIAFLDD